MASATIPKVLPIYTAPVAAIQYSLAGDRETDVVACATIVSKNTIEMQMPKTGGVFDRRMGTIDSRYVCGTCALNKEQCHGHPGMVRLSCACLSPAFIPEIMRWLRVICPQCGAAVGRAEDIAALPAQRASKRLDYLSKHMSNKNKLTTCAACGTAHPNIMHHPRFKYAFMARTITADGATVDIPLYPHNVAEIFARVSDATVIALGRAPISHPMALVWRLLYVPPVTLRPDTKKPGGRGSNPDSLTAALKDIIQASMLARPLVPNEIDQKYAAEIEALNELVATMLIGGNDKNKSIALRIKGKEGRFRGNLLGRRASGLARSTIDGSPRLPLDTISVPLFMLQTLQLEEVVTSRNRAILLQFVANGDRYPGCSRVIKRGGALKFKPNSPGLIIEEGDTVVHDITDGTIVGFNRQPTLTQSNVTAMRVAVDEESLSIGMSVLVCPFFNADFDGDQMNIIGYARESSLNEQMMLTGVSAHLVSSTTASVCIGQSGDALIGIAKFTQGEFALDRYHACLLFSTTTTLPRFASAGARITNRRVVSEVLAPTPISYTGNSAYYSSGAVWARWMHAAPEDRARVRIVGGRLESGCLDKACLGAGANSIYQAMVHEFGPQRTQDCIYNMQQLGVNFIAQIGFTTGIGDFAIDPARRVEIDRISSEIILRARGISDRLDHGEIIAPPDTDVARHYEDLQIAAQRTADDYHEPIFRGITRPERNGVFEMMATGCKGQPTFLVNMAAALCLILINGERVARNFGHQRTLAYFARYDEAPEARGFVADSFISGLSAPACVFNAMMSRIDIITRAMFTSVTGDQTRKAVKALESILTNNIRAVVKDTDIVSLAYGGDYFDPRSLEAATYAPAMISDADFEARYHTAGFDDEFAALTRDRAEYRAIYRRLEATSVRDKMSARVLLPFNIPRLIERMKLAMPAAPAPARSGGAAAPKQTSAASAQPRADLAAGARAVAQFCEAAPYLFMNEMAERRRAWVPPHMDAAATLIRMYVRAELCTARMVAQSLSARDVSTVLEAICASIVTALIDPGTAVGIIAAQSYSEPHTQNMLDSYKLTALGGGGRSMMGKYRDVMCAPPVERLIQPTMAIILRDRAAAASVDAVRTLALRIEMLTLSQIVETWVVLYEKYGAPLHPRYAHEAAMIAQFAADNPLLAPPGDLANWCIRYELSKSALVQKNISVAAIIARLREKYGDLYLVYTNERAPTVVMRVYVRNSGIESFSVASTETERTSSRRRGIRSRFRDDRIRDIAETINATVIRGVDGIRRASAERLVRTTVDASGAVVDLPAQYYVRTLGTNMARIACMPEVDAQMLQTDALQEIAATLGIEAARARIITEMRTMVDKCNARHYMVFADEMTRTGAVTSIERGGLTVREPANVTLRAGQADPQRTLVEAACLARRENVNAGLSGQTIVGSVPRIGTMYNAIAIDADFIRAHRKSAVSALSNL